MSFGQWLASIASLPPWHLTEGGTTEEGPAVDDVDAEKEEEKEEEEEEEEVEEGAGTEEQVAVSSRIGVVFLPVQAPFAPWVAAVNPAPCVLRLALTPHVSRPAPRAGSAPRAQPRLSSTRRWREKRERRKRRKRRRSRRMLSRRTTTLSPKTAPVTTRMIALAALTPSVASMGTRRGGQSFDSRSAKGLSGEEMRTRPRHSRPPPQPLRYTDRTAHYHGRRAHPAPTHLPTTSQTGDDFIIDWEVGVVTAFWYRETDWSEHQDFVPYQGSWFARR